MSELKDIELDLIEEIANYREVEPPSAKDPDMIELAENVKNEGVYQSILVRPHPTKYGFFQLIFGHRRRLASQMAGLKTIPANIKHVADEDILEIQVIENMKRKDVHPMDEGLAFKSLMDQKDWSVQEISARFGKKEFYVRQRLRLTELSKSWQHVFFKGAILLTDALKVAMLSPADQKDLYESEGPDKDDLRKSDLKVELNEWDFNKYKGDLNKAAFDLTDPFLDKKMGPCTGCKYNSGTALLLPEYVGTSRCSNTTCFKNKTQKSFTLRLQSATEDPAMLFVCVDHGDHQKEISPLVKEHGIEVLGYGRVIALEPPDKPDREEWESDHEGDFDSEKEKKAAWQKELDYYDEDVREYEKKVGNGKYQKALVVAGGDKGKFIYVQLAKKSNSSLQPTKTSKEVQESVKSGEATLSDIEGEISRIKENIKNAQSLDTEKIHEAVMQKYGVHTSVAAAAGPSLSAIETACLRWYFFDKLHLLSNVINNEGLQKAFGITAKQFKHTEGRMQSVWDFLLKVTDEQLATVFRHFMHEQYSDATPRTQPDGAFIMRKMAEVFLSTEIEEIEASFQVKANTRQNNADKKIAPLQEKAKELKAAKKTPKKAAPKKEPKQNHLGQELTDYGLAGPSLRQLSDDDPEDEG